jgi:mRNA interferase MazF
VIQRGDVYDADLVSGGQRPVVIVTRESAIVVLSNVTVVGVTSNARGHRAEVPLGLSEGLDRECVANCDDIATIPRDWLRRRRGGLGPAVLRGLDQALMIALGLTD